LEEIGRRVREVLSFGIPGTPFTAGKLILLATLLALLLYFNRRFTRWIVESVLARRHLDIGVRQAVGTLVKYAIATLGVVVILQAVGIDLSAVTVLAGALGVGLGFGLQNVASNFVSGLIILFERPIKVGDRIEVGGVSGEVRRIGARATTMVTEENIAVIVPNSQFITERVTNWSHTGPLTAFLVHVRVSWQADADLVRRLLLEVATEHANVLSEPAPEVELRDLWSGMQFVLQVWSTEYLQGEGRLKSELNFAIRKRLREHDIDSGPALVALADAQRDTLSSTRP
jgi:small-conductance mechanosensitive channel